VLGSGNEAERQKRLKDLAGKQVAEDQKTLGADVSAKEGGALVNNGYNLVIYGQYDKGIALIQKGIAKGGLKHPEDAKLHLGEAYLLAGKADDAAKTLKTVQGGDGTQDLARLWALHAKA
jgi:TolA-binding protein